MRRVASVLRLVRAEFLLTSVMAVSLGWATACQAGAAWQHGWALLTLVLAVLLHAAANVLNDAEDAKSGADAANEQAIAPFTGGAGLIQQGRVSERNTRLVAWILLLVVLLGGWVLAAYRGWALLGYGLAGMGLAWGYSAPPLRLMTRGLGELSVAAAWVLMVAGADYVLRGSVAAQPLALAAGFGLLMANVLLLNGVPDAASDALVGKRTLVVRLQAKAQWLYAGLALCAHGLVLLWAWLWDTGLWPLLTLPLAGAALWAWRRQQLRRAIVLTIATAQLHAGLWLVTVLGPMVFAAKAA